jgi:hypothetical protein
MDDNPAYRNYWKRKELMRKCPAFPVRHWWPTETGLCEIESEIFAAVRNSRTLLDFGAGDHRIRRKFQAAGFQGDYQTLDIGAENEHTYRDLTDVQGKFDAILLLDVIEHLPLDRGLTLLLRLIDYLNPGGVLVVQTPNARCVRFPLSTDMTHLQVYNLPDLWSFLTANRMRADGYRVVLGNRGRFANPMTLASRYVITRWLGADYADNIVLIAHKA